MKRRLIRRRGLALVLALTGPLLFALNVRQAFRFTTLQARIDAIIAAYKDRFDQESVLRVIGNACVAF